MTDVTVLFSTRKLQHVSPPVFANTGRTGGYGTYPLQKNTQFEEDHLGYETGRATYNTEYHRSTIDGGTTSSAFRTDGGEWTPAAATMHTAYSRGDGMQTARMSHHSTSAMRTGSISHSASNNRHNSSKLVAHQQHPIVGRPSEDQPAEWGLWCGDGVTMTALASEEQINNHSRISENTGEYNTKYHTRRSLPIDASSKVLLQSSSMWSLTYADPSREIGKQQLATTSTAVGPAPQLYPYNNVNNLYSSATPRTAIGVEDFTNQPNARLPSTAPDSKTFYCRLHLHPAIAPANTMNFPASPKSGASVGYRKSSSTATRGRVEDPVSAARRCIWDLNSFSPSTAPWRKGGVGVSGNPNSSVDTRKTQLDFTLRDGCVTIPTADFTCLSEEFWRDAETEVHQRSNFFAAQGTTPRTIMGGRPAAGAFLENSGTAVDCIGWTAAKSSEGASVLWRTARDFLFFSRTCGVRILRVYWRDVLSDCGEGVWGKVLRLIEPRVAALRAPNTDNTTVADRALPLLRPPPALADARHAVDFAFADARVWSAFPRAAACVERMVSQHFLSHTLYTDENNNYARPSAKTSFNSTYSSGSGTAANSAALEFELKGMTDATRAAVMRQQRAADSLSALVTWRKSLHLNEKLKRANQHQTAIPFRPMIHPSGGGKLITVEEVHINGDLLPPLLRSAAPWVEAVATFTALTFDGIVWSLPLFEVDFQATTEMRSMSTKVSQTTEAKRIPSPSDKRREQTNSAKNTNWVSAAARVLSFVSRVLPGTVPSTTHDQSGNENRTSFNETDSASITPTIIDTPSDHVEYAPHHLLRDTGGTKTFGSKVLYFDLSVTPTEDEADSAGVAADAVNGLPQLSADHRWHDEGTSSGDVSGNTVSPNSVPYGSLLKPNDQISVRCSTENLTWVIQRLDNAMLLLEEMPSRVSIGVQVFGPHPPWLSSDASDVDDDELTYLSNETVSDSDWNRSCLQGLVIAIKLAQEICMLLLFISGLPPAMTAIIWDAPLVSTHLPLLLVAPFQNFIVPTARDGEKYIDALVALCHAVVMCDHLAFASISEMCPWLSVLYWKKRVACIKPITWINHDISEIECCLYNPHSQPTLPDPSVFTSVFTHLSCKEVPEALDCVIKTMRDVEDRYTDAETRLADEFTILSEFRLALRHFLLKADLTNSLIPLLFESLHKRILNDSRVLNDSTKAGGTNPSPAFAADREMTMFKRVLVRWHDTASGSEESFHRVAVMPRASIEHKIWCELLEELYSPTEDRIDCSTKDNPKVGIENSSLALKLVAHYAVPFAHGRGDVNEHHYHNQDMSSRNAIIDPQVEVAPFKILCELSYLVTDYPFVQSYLRQYSENESFSALRMWTLGEACQQEGDHLKAASIFAALGTLGLGSDPLLEIPSRFNEARHILLQRAFWSVAQLLTSNDEILKKLSPKSLPRVFPRYLRHADAIAVDESVDALITVVLNGLNSELTYIIKQLSN